MLTLAYIALGLAGCLFIVVSAIFGNTADGGDGDGDTATGDAHQTYGVSGDGHGDVSAGSGHGAAFHFPFFSPLALATLLASIGAWGLIAKFGFKAGDGLSLIIAVPAAFGTAYAITYVGFRLVSSSRGSSQIRVGDLVGVDGEVITPIPAGGIGEVAAIVNGERFTSAARELEGRAVARGAMVKVVRMAGGTIIVNSGSKEAPDA